MSCYVDYKISLFNKDKKINLKEIEDELNDLFYLKRIKCDIEIDSDMIEMSEVDYIKYDKKIPSTLTEFCKANHLRWKMIISSEEGSEVYFYELTENYEVVKTFSLIEAAKKFLS